MFALERKTNRRWIRYAVCGNRALLDRVRAGQPRPKDWRVVAVPYHAISFPANIARSA